jgi:hypothetical protein
MSFNVGYGESALYSEDQTGTKTETQGYLPNYGNTERDAQSYLCRVVSKYTPELTVGDSVIK